MSISTGLEKKRGRVEHVSIGVLDVWKGCGVGRTGSDMQCRAESGTWGELACGLTIDADILEVVKLRRKMACREVTRS